MSVLFCMVPLALLSYLTIHLADRAVVREVDARVRTTSAVSAVLVQKQMQGVADLTASYATRPILVDALGDGDRGTFQNDTILQQLAQLSASQPGLGGAFLTDTSCRLTQIEPATPAIIGVDFSFRDWCRGVKATDRPYVSEAFRSALVGQPLVVASAVMVRATSGDQVGKPLGILGVVYPLNSIRDFTNQLAQAQGIRLVITDQRGSVLVGTTGAVDAGGLMSAADDPRIAAALRGQSGASRFTGARGDTLSAYAPVHAVGWTVTAEVPAHEALSGVRDLRATVLSVAGGLALVLTAGIVVLARTRRQRQGAQRDLVEREAQTRSILEAATDAFVSMDAAGKISGWAGQAQEVFGWTQAEALGRALSETIIPPAYRAQHEAGLAHFLATGEGPVLNQRIEITALHRDGREFPAELAIWPTHSRAGRAPTFNAFVHDISDRKLAEADLAAARDQAVEMSRLKSEFLATMSHEIRTPMNGVIGLTGLLLDTQLSETQRHHAEGVRASGEALLGIINDILDFSKIEAGKLELETVDFDLAHALEDVAALVAESARAKDLELVAYCHPEVPTALRGDVGRIRQILLNFATNAVKFTAAGEVVLRAGLAEESSAGHVIVRFEVVDTGVGLDATTVERLFEPFSQADASTTRRYGGTGLGLAICRRLAEAMDGTVGVDSQPGRGSTFWLRLPLARASEPIVVPDADANSLEGRRVLVVDDNQTNRLVLASQLLAWDIHADLACDAAEALKHLRHAAAESRPYDLALLDMAMPDTDGMELAAIVSSDPQLCSVRLLLLSSVSVEADAAAEAGFVARLTKPVRLSSLYDAMVHAITPGPDDAASTRPPVAVLQSKGTLLIVEDHSINQQVAKGIVTKLGYGCDVAADGREALTALERRSYAAVLMDCHMPEMDGFEATAEIRRREAGERHVPIIAMTAGAMAEDREKCIAAGMDDYVSKPVKEGALEAALNRWVLSRKPAFHQENSGAGPANGVLDADQVEGLRELAAVSDDPNFLQGLVDHYLDQAGVQVEALRSAVANGDAEGVKAAGHGLKGTSATMGARGVAAACEVVESSAARGVIAQTEALDCVAEELERAARALRLEAPRGR